MIFIERFCLSPFFTCDHSAATTKTISSVCAKCVIIRKSGKMSCCGRGGTWFGTCGGAGNTKVDRTWYEGIRACKAGRQSKTAMGQKLRAAQQKQKLNGSSNDNLSKAIATAITRGVSNSVNASTSAPIIAPTDPALTTPSRPRITKTSRSYISNDVADMVTATPSSPPSTGTPIIGREFTNPLNTGYYISFLLIIVCWC